jgi:UDP-N-acetylglucosamine 2-epimerase (non-hydrolysing)
VVKRPLVVVRRSTERPEAMGEFAVLVDAGPAVGWAVRDILGQGDGLRERLRRVPCPFGDETAADEIVAALLTLCHERAVGAGQSPSAGAVMGAPR